MEKEKTIFEPYVSPEVRVEMIQPVGVLCQSPNNPESYETEDFEEVE